MMLEYLSHADAADTVVKAVEAVLRDPPRTRDIGGSANTEEVGKVIATAL
jgi:tartrate dehydrogenase/decarboxylase / D-malate dehydrogenase